MILDGKWITDGEALEIIQRLRYMIDQLREVNIELQEQLRQYRLDEEEQDCF